MSDSTDLYRKQLHHPTKTAIYYIKNDGSDIRVSS